MKFIGQLVVISDGQSWVRYLEGTMDLSKTINTLKTAPSEYDRGFAAKDLGRTEMVEALPPLISALSDSDEYVYTSAIEAIGELGFKEAAEYIYPFCKHPQANVRRKACETLCKIKNPLALAVLKACLTDESILVKTVADTSIREMEAFFEKQGKKGGSETKPAEIKAKPPDFFGPLNLPEIIQAAIAGTNFYFKQQENQHQILVTIPKENRKQWIYIIQDLKDYHNRETVKIFTVCGPATQINYEWALKISFKYPYWSMGIMELNNALNFVVYDSIPIKLITADFLRDIILSFAERGDFIEKQLTQKDVF